MVHYCPAFMGETYPLPPLPPLLKQGALELKTRISAELKPPGRVCGITRNSERPPILNLAKRKLAAEL